MTNDIFFREEAKPSYLSSNILKFPSRPARVRTTLVEPAKPNIKTGLRQASTRSRSHVSFHPQEASFSVRDTLLPQRSITSPGELRYLNAVKPRSLTNRSRSEDTALFSNKMYIL